tara:strand:- start:103 stop:729 length:627 start_codon:yes stop_codon:yes gene_type:complete
MREQPSKGISTQTISFLLEYFPKEIVDIINEHFKKMKKKVPCSICRSITHKGSKNGNITCEVVNKIQFYYWRHENLYVHKKVYWCEDCKQIKKRVISLDFPKNGIPPGTLQHRTRCSICWLKKFDNIEMYGDDQVRAGWWQSMNQISRRLIYENDDNDELEYNEWDEPVWPPGPNLINNEWNPVHINWDNNVAAVPNEGVVENWEQVN